MTFTNQDIKSLFKGEFVSGPDALTERLKKVKAYLFDWDGVFNDGEKKENGSSSFSEVEAMGTNLLRLNHYICTGTMPVAMVVTGEKNDYAFTLARREHFDAVYFRIKHKHAALEHLCLTYRLEPGDVAFFFDDVLDLSLASEAGLRMMTGRQSNPLLLQYVREKKLADYISFYHGGQHGLRESIELLMGLSGQYEQTLHHRIRFSELYQEYLALRNKTNTEIFTADDKRNIIPA